jgi:peptidoglycan-associated lipoprotein
MKTILRAGAVLIMTGVFLLSAHGQVTGEGVAPAATGGPGVRSFDLAGNVTWKFAKVAETTGIFLMPGGSIDGSYNFAHGLGVAAELNIEAAHNIVPAVSLTQISVVAGPRYTFYVGNSRHPVGIYGQFLAGEVWASNSIFPGPKSATTIASSTVIQTGGGLNIHLGRAVSFRVMEADYIRTSLPNNTNNSQSDLRLSDGVVFHF